MVRSLRWQSAIWIVNGFFLVMTVVFGSIPQSGSKNREGIVQYLAQFSLAEEKNLATYWEGWCLLLVSVLALQRFFFSEKAAPGEKRSWAGLAVLAAGLSLDEIGSFHERAPLFFSSWGLSGVLSANIPFAVPALFILIITLRGMWRRADHRCFWLTLGAFVAFGSVAFQEHLEHAVAWPLWARGIRFGIEEGTELFGVFLLLSAVLAPTEAYAKKLDNLLALVPRVETFVFLRTPIVFLTLMLSIPLAVLSVMSAEDETFRGIPAAWLPFVLLNLSFMVASACALNWGLFRKRFFTISSLCLFFSLDQILVLQRVVDKNLVRGELANLMFPCIATLCLTIPTLRTRVNILLLAALLPASPLLFASSDLFAWTVLPLQALAVFWVLASGAAKTEPQRSGALETVGLMQTAALHEGPRTP